MPPHTYMHLGWFQVLRPVTLGLNWLKQPMCGTRCQFCPDSRKNGALYSQTQFLVLKFDGSEHLEPALHDTSRRIVYVYCVWYDGSIIRKKSAMLIECIWSIHYSPCSRPFNSKRWIWSILTGCCLCIPIHKSHFIWLACVYIWLAKACYDSALTLVCTGNRTRWTRWFSPNKSLSVMRCYRLRAQLNGHIKYTLPATW